MSSLSAGLGLTVQQQQTLAPQQQYALRLLRMSAQELLDEADLAAEENPLLEREAPAREEERQDQPALHEEAEAVRGEDAEQFPEDRGPLENVYSAWTGSGAGSPDELPAVERVAAPTSLREDLLAELRTLDVDAVTRKAVLCLIDELDDSGMLPAPLEEIVGDLADVFDAPLETWRRGLALLQTFDPPGVGAASAVECLTLQVRRRIEEAPADRAAGTLLIGLIERHLKEIALQDRRTLLAAAQGDEALLDRALTLLKTLNPHPASQYSFEATQYVVADVLVRRTDGVWTAELNASAQPGLRLSSLAQGAAVDETTPFGRYLAEAKRLIAGIEARRSTLLRAAQFAVGRQQAFFEQGRAALVPLTIGEAARELGLSDSTVSRAVSGKFFQCPAGTFELRSLFLLPAVQATDSLGMSASVSPARIRARICELIAAEPADKRLSDQALTDLLRGEGFDITRRTVATYRDLEGIPTARLRGSKR